MVAVLAVVRELRETASKGELEPETALKQLLKGTGLTFRVTADRAILVENPKATLRAIKPDLRVQNEASPAQNMSAESRAGRIEEIFVTATRREQNLREVPQSVTALTQRSLERVQADDFECFVTHSRQAVRP